MVAAAAMASAGMEAAHMTSVVVVEPMVVSLAALVEMVAHKVFLVLVSQAVMVERVPVPVAVGAVELENADHLLGT